MNRLVSAELLKLRTVRSAWLLLLTLPLVAVVSLLDAALDPVEHNTGLVDFMDVSFVVVGIAVAAFAASQVGTEFQRRMVALDYLSVPGRVPVLTAKLLTYGAVAAVVGLLSSVVAHVVVTPIAMGRDIPLDGITDILARIAAVTIAAALVGALGAAIGVLVPHPAIAVGAIVAWQIAVGVLGMALGIGEYLPIGLITTVAHLGGTVLLPVAFASLAAYVVVTGGAALAVGRHRDLS